MVPSNTSPLNSDFSDPNRKISEAGVVAILEREEKELAREDAKENGIPGKTKSVQ